MIDLLTDSEIVKALECCVSEQYTCRDCPYQEIKHYSDDEGFEIMPNGKRYDDWSCERWLNVDLLDLINRLQAENERLKEENKLLIDNDVRNKYPNCVLVEKGRIYTRTLEDYDELIADISAEAYKECVGKVSNIITEIYYNHIFGSNDLEAEEIDAIINFSHDVTYKVDNLLKELVGDKNYRQLL